MNIGFISLGCAKNQVDSEEIISYLKRNGAVMTSNPEIADVIFINTCAFIEAAKKEAIDTILEMGKYGKPIVVLGCLAQRYAKDLKDELPEVKLWIPFGSYATFGEQFKKAFPEFEATGEVNPNDRVLLSPKYEAYLRIAEGCNDFCTFCAIPYIRGRFRSVPLDILKRQLDDLEKEEVKSLTLIAQDTSMYGRDMGTDLTELVKNILDHKGFEFVKLMYLYPDEIPESLIDFYAGEKHLTPYFDLPLQHSSNHILKRMNRRGTRESYIELLNKVREKVPNIVLRTTMMVGFPGETEEDFEDLLDFVKTMRFDHLGAFIYNREEGTPAYNFKDQVPANIKRKRYNELMKTQAKISYELNKARIGKTYKVLVSDYDSKTFAYNGISDLFAPDDIDGRMFIFSEEPLHRGDMVEVEIVNASVYDLDAKVTRIISKVSEED